MTGVVNRVSIWLMISPPMMAIPSGRRSSDPAPVPRARGSDANMAAMVVIMIGLNRSRQRMINGVARGFASRSLGAEREVDYHDAVFLD